jgi:hypothetical protein
MPSTKHCAPNLSKGQSCSVKTVRIRSPTSQSFKMRGIRLALILTVVLLLAFPVYHIRTLPRARGNRFYARSRMGLSRAR